MSDIIKFLSSIGVKVDDYKFDVVQSKKYINRSKDNRILSLEKKSWIVGGDGKTIYFADYGNGNKSTITDGRSHAGTNYFIIRVDNPDQKVIVKSANKHSEVKKIHDIYMGSSHVRLANDTRIHEIMVFTKEGSLLQRFTQDPVSHGFVGTEIFKF